MEVDHGKLVSESKELSQEFLKEWINKETNFLRRSPKQDAILVHRTNTNICVLLERANPIPLGEHSVPTRAPERLRVS